MTRRWLAVLVCLACAACESDALQDPVTSPNGVRVALVATVEGCRVYRVKVDGGTIYTTVCGRESVATSWTRTESCGRRCTRQVPVVVVTTRRGGS